MENFTPIDLKSSTGLWNKKAAIVGGAILVIALLIFFVRLATQNRTTTQSKAQPPQDSCPVGYVEVNSGSCLGAAIPAQTIGMECCPLDPTPGGSCQPGWVPPDDVSGLCPGGGQPSLVCGGDNCSAGYSYCCPPAPTDPPPTNPPIPTDTPTPTPTDLPIPSPSPTCFVPQPTLSIVCPNGCIIATPTPTP